MTYTQSKTWESESVKEYGRWMQLEKVLTRMTFIPRSPFVPKTYPEWLAYRVVVNKSEAQKAQRKRDAALEERNHPKCPIISKFAEIRFTDSLSSVLAFPTVWTMWSTPTEDRPVVPWPGADEMREEGDERMTSGYRRYLPLLREPGNETVTWKQKPARSSWLFDAVWRRKDIFQKAQEEIALKGVRERKVEDEIESAMATEEIMEHWVEVMEQNIKDGHPREIAESVAELSARKFAGFKASQKVNEDEIKESKVELEEMEKLLCDHLIEGLNCVED